MPTTRSLHRTFWLFFALLMLAYGLWLRVFWPGVLGNDSLAIMLEIQSSDGSFHSGKPSAWYYFVKTLFDLDQKVENPIAFQLAFAAAVFARILAWTWCQGFKKTCLFGLVFICLTPHTPYFLGSLYADGFFSVAVVGLLFELWRVTSRRALGATSTWVIFFTLPVAAFMRPNGLIFMLGVLPVLYVLGRRDRIRLGLITLAWCLVAASGAKLHATRSHGFMFPLAMFETAGFMQPHPFGLWQETPRVSEKTLQALAAQRPLQNIVENYDRDYWDSLVFKPGGPDLTRIPDSTKEVVVTEFLRYNLWRNFPAFLGSRVNVFMVAVLAQGGFPGFDYTGTVLKGFRTASSFRPFKMPATEQVLRGLQNFSESVRWILWTPLLGMVLLVQLLWRACKTRQLALLVVAVPLAAQWLAVFSFSIAGEYRYLLPFFMAPLVLLPMLLTAPSKPSAV